MGVLLKCLVRFLLTENALEGTGGNSEQREGRLKVKTTSQYKIIKIMYCTRVVTDVQHIVCSGGFFPGNEETRCDSVTNCSIET